MGPELSAGGGDENFEFAFNSRNFSDRILLIKIVANPGYVRAGCDVNKEFYGNNSEVNPGSNQPDVDGENYENYDGEHDVMIGESTSGENRSQNSDPLCCMDHTPVVQVKSIFINSAILAAKSPFFYKLFSNGMRESDQCHANLSINASEEASLMEVLWFMYSGKLSTTSTPLVVDVLKAADKFEVGSCIRYCSELLSSLPMTLESALLYLELPSSVTMAPAVRSLTDAAKGFLLRKYRDIDEFPEEELINLPLSGVEAIFSSDDLLVSSEDKVYYFLLVWVRAKYPSLEERREILASRLIRLVRFPFMTCSYLRMALSCKEMDHEISTKAVLEALFFKSGAPQRQALEEEEEEEALGGNQFVARAYRIRPVKVIGYEVTHPQCIISFDLKREVCTSLLPTGGLCSEDFHLGGKCFFFVAKCEKDEKQDSDYFKLLLGMDKKGYQSFELDYDVSIRMRPAGDHFVWKQGDLLPTPVN